MESQGWSPRSGTSADSRPHPGRTSNPQHQRGGITMDERQLNQLLAENANESVRKAILDNIPNESQRKLVESVMTSPQWTMSEIVQRNAELEKEIKRLQ